MAKMNINIDLDENGVTEQVEKAIEDGVQEAGDSLGDEAIEKARLKIIEEGAVWKGELLAAFQTESRKVGKTTYIKVRNDSDHAAPVNDGRSAGKEAPPLHNLLPWVRKHLAHWYPEDQDYADDIANYFRENSNVDLGPYTDLEIWRAYELQQKIHRHGIDAVEFMDFAEEWLERHGQFVVKAKIGEELFKRGLK